MIFQSSLSSNDIAFQENYIQRAESGPTVLDGEEQADLQRKAFTLDDISEENLDPELVHLFHAAKHITNDTEALFDDIMDHVRKGDNASVDMLRPALLLASKCGRSKEATWLFRRIDFLNSVTIKDVELLFDCYCTNYSSFIHKGSPFYAEALLRHFEAQPGNLRPTAKMYRNVMRALSGHGRIGGNAEARVRAESILYRLEALFADGDVSMQPSFYDYADVACGWLTLVPRTKANILRAIHLLQSGTENSAARNFEHDDQISNPYPFFKALDSYARCPEMTWSQRATAADNLFVFLLEKYESGDFKLEIPDAKHLRSVLRYWGSSDQSEIACLRSIGIFYKVKKLVDNGVLKAGNVYTLETLLRMIATIAESRKIGYGDTVRDVLLLMDLSTINTETDIATAEKLIYRAVKYLCFEGTKEMIMVAYDFMEKLRLHEKGKLAFSEIQCFQLIDTFARRELTDCGNETMNLIDMLEELLPSPAELEKRVLIYSLAMIALKRHPAIYSSDLADRLLKVILDQLGSNFRSGSCNLNPIDLLDIQIMSESPESHDRAVQLLFLMDDAYENGNIMLNVRESLWRTVLAKVSQKEGAHTAAMAIFQRIQQRDNNGKIKCPLTTFIFAEVMKAWMISDAPSRIENMELLYETMNDLHKSGDKFVAPNIDHLNMIMKAYATVGGVEASRRIVELYQEAHARFKQGNTDFKPILATTRALTDALLSSDEKALDDAMKIFMNIEISAEMTEEVSKVVEALVDNERSEDATNLFSRLQDQGLGNPALFKRLLAGTSASRKTTEAAIKAPDTRENEHDEANDEIMSVIDILVTSNNADDLSMADSILIEAEKSHQENSNSPRPSCEVYNRLITAFSQIGNNEKVAELETRKRFLHSSEFNVNGVHDVDDAEDKSLSSDEEIHSGSEIDNDKETSESFPYHEETNSELEVPDDDEDYDVDEPHLLELEENDGGLARQELLQLLVAELGDECTSVTSESFQKAFVQVASREPLPLFTMLALIRLAASIKGAIVERSHFELAMQAYQSEGSTLAVEYGWSLFKIMDHLAQQGREDLRPTHSSFDDIMKWARTKVVPSVEMQALLLMEKRFLDGRDELKPNLSFYNQCLFLLAQQGASGVAQFLLGHMIQSPVAEVDAMSFYYVLNALTQVPNKAGSAWRVLQLMANNGFSPDTRCINQVLKACKISDNYFDVAFAVTTRFNSQDRPDSSTTSLLLDLILQMRDCKERKKLAVKVVSMCTKKGLINRGFLEKLLTNEKLTKQTLGDAYLGDPAEVWARLPERWTTNI